MGGSGGGYFNITRPDELAKKLRESEEESQNIEFETKVSAYINELLTEYNDRDVDAITKHLESIKEALKKEIEGTVDLLYGGSVTKHTYVDGLSDVDALVLINSTELEKSSPTEVKDYFFRRLQERLPKTEIVKGNLAVTVRYKDIEIQLLPAIKIPGGFKIADSDGMRWSRIHPNRFTALLTSVNQQCNGKVVPTIKIAKSIIATFPENRKLSGYHVESLAVDIFKDYDGPKTTKSMLKYFFSEGSTRVLNPIKDKTGQSLYVDEYLGEANSLGRKIVADSLGRIGRKIKNADGAQSMDQWKNLLGNIHG